MTYTMTRYIRHLKCNERGETSQVLFMILYCPGIYNIILKVCTTHGFLFRAAVTTADGILICS